MAFFATREAASRSFRSLLLLTGVLVSLSVAMVLISSVELGLPVISIVETISSVVGEERWAV